MIICIVLTAIFVCCMGTAEAYKNHIDTYRNLVVNLPDDDSGKIKAINDTVCSLLVYDHTLSVYDTDEALERGTGTCEAYANLFHRIATACGLTDRVVYGTAENAGRIGNHAWNETKIDGKWVYTDTTWNDCAGEDLFVGSPALWSDHKVKGYEIHILGATICKKENR